SAIDGHERLVGSVTLEMNGFRDELLTCPALALNQNRAAACGHLRDKIEDFEDLFTFSDDVGVTESLFERTPQLKGFGREVALFDRIVHDHNKLFVVPGLCNVIEGTLLDCADGSLERADCGNDDHGQRGVNPLDVLKNVHPGFSREHQIQKHYIEPVLLDLLETFLAGSGGIGGQALRIQQQLDAFSNLLLIVNDEDDSLSFRHSLVSLPLEIPA